MEVSQGQHVHLALRFTGQEGGRAFHSSMQTTRAGQGRAGHAGKIAASGITWHGAQSAQDAQAKTDGHALHRWP